MSRIFGLLLALIAACSDTPVALNVGDSAPAWEAPRPDGTAVRFPDAFSGRPVVLRFWADWCRYCEGEMRAIEPVYRAMRADGLEILAINTGQDAATVAAFMKKLAVTYPALLDETYVIARRYGVSGLPTTFFVDGQGKIRAKIIGEADAATFERHARMLLP